MRVLFFLSAGAWGMIGGQSLFRGSGGFMKQRLLQLSRGKRIEAGHEEVLIDVTLGEGVDD